MRDLGARRVGSTLDFGIWECVRMVPPYSGVVVRGWAVVWELEVEKVGF